jgi:hypothetical protein
MTQHKEKKYVVDARAFIDRYRCSTCWGTLTFDRITDDYKDPDYNQVEVHCEDVECSGMGFVSGKYVERRSSEDMADYQEARRNLKTALNLPDPNAGKTADQLIKELGF